MKTNYVDMKQRYKLAHRQVWATTPEWKQLAIREHLSNGDTNSRFYNEFIQESIQLAEDTSTELLGIYEPVDLTGDGVSTEEVPAEVK